MKGGASPHGYTIVEVMIFLAVSGALLASALLIFQGQSGRTEFAAGAREMEARMQDLINDVSTGYYARTNNFSCKNSGGSPNITPPNTQQGTNEECIFIGRAAHFDLDAATDDGLRYNQYSIAGVRQAGSGFLKHEVKDFAEAQPRAIVNPPQGVDLTQEEYLPPGLRFGTMYYRDNLTYQPIDAVAFFSSFSQYSGSSLQPGTISINVVPLLGNAAAGNSAKDVVAGQIQALGGAPVPAVINPNGGVVICFNSTSSNQYAKLSIGDWRGQTTTNMEIKTGQCPSNLATT